MTQKNLSSASNSYTTHIRIKNALCPTSRKHYYSLPVNFFCYEIHQRILLVPTLVPYPKPLLHQQDKPTTCTLIVLQASDKWFQFRKIHYYAFLLFSIYLYYKTLCLKITLKPIINGFGFIVVGGTYSYDLRPFI